MAETKHDRVDAQLGRLIQLAHDSFEPLSEAASEQAFEATLDELSAERQRTRRRWQVVMVAAAALVLLVTGAVTSQLLSRPKPLAMSLQGAVLQQDGVVRAAAEGKPSLRFSDGTRIELGQAASLRVRAIEPSGARLALEQGELRADVVHAPSASWVFEAGPFTVDVKGTTFALMWSAAEGRLDLRLEHGLLAIHTPFASQPISLQGGQRLVAMAGDRRFTISELSAPEAGVEVASEVGRAAAALAGAGPATAVPSGSAAVPPPVASAVARSIWAERFGAGDFKTIVAEAEAQGLEVALSQRGLEDLALLSDAARYTGKADVARRALLAERQRFGKTARAIDAAFMLGRLEEPGNPNEAERWYDRYLSDAPRGSYAAEALGRKMLLVERVRGRAAARPIAEAYVKKYPQGPHAQSARRIVQE